MHKRKSLLFLTILLFTHSTHGMEKYTKAIAYVLIPSLCIYSFYKYFYSTQKTEKITPEIKKIENKEEIENEQDNSIIIWLEETQEANYYEKYYDSKYEGKKGSPFSLTLKQAHAIPLLNFYIALFGHERMQTAENALKIGYRDVLENQTWDDLTKPVPSIFYFYPLASSLWLSHKLIQYKNFLDTSFPNPPIPVEIEHLITSLMIQLNDNELLSKICSNFSLVNYINDRKSPIHSDHKSPHRYTHINTTERASRIYEKYHENNSTVFKLGSYYRHEGNNRLKINCIVIPTQLDIKQDLCTAEANIAMNNKHLLVLSTLNYNAKHDHCKTSWDESKAQYGQDGPYRQYGKRCLSSTKAEQKCTVFEYTCHNNPEQQSTIIINSLKKVMTFYPNYPFNKLGKGGVFEDHIYVGGIKKNTPHNGMIYDVAYLWHKYFSIIPTTEIIPNTLTLQQLGCLLHLSAYANQSAQAMKQERTSAYVTLTEKHPMKSSFETFDASKQDQLKSQLFITGAS